MNPEERRSLGRRKLVRTFFGKIIGFPLGGAGGGPPERSVSARGKLRLGVARDRVALDDP